jgi:hypothetical protein
MTCMVRRVPIPPEILEWSKLAMEHESVEQATTSALFFIIAKFSEMRANLTTTEYRNDSHRVVADALEIDEMFYKWSLNIPESFHWRPVYLPEPDEEVFADYYDVYHNVFIGSVWNSFRSVRIMLHEVLIDHLVNLCSSPEYITPSEETLSAYQTQICTSKAIINTLALETCASVPYYFHYHQRDMENFGIRPQAKAMEGYILMWPLYTAAVAGRVTAQMREWIAERLNNIGDVMGVRHAYALGLLAGVKRELSDLEVQMEKEDWDGYTRDSATEYWDFPNGNLDL